METIGWQIIAGMTSSTIFVFSNFLMLYKAIKTNDLKSYSLGHLAFSNLGNLIHWVYISSLPFGPIWFLHAYFTIVTALMLFWYFRYKRNPNLDYRSLPLVPVILCICGCVNTIWNRLINNETALTDDLGKPVILREENLQIAVETGQLRSRVKNAASNILALSD